MLSKKNGLLLLGLCLTMSCTKIVKKVEDCTPAYFIGSKSAKLQLIEDRVTLGNGLNSSTISACTITQFLHIIIRQTSVFLLWLVMECLGLLMKMDFVLHK